MATASVAVALAIQVPVAGALVTATFRDMTPQGSPVGSTSHQIAAAAHFALW